MMYNNQNNTAVAQNSFMLPSLNTGMNDFSSEELAEDMDGLTMSFPRAKIVSGGAAQFEVPSDDPDNPEYVKTLEGVILFNHSACSYWPEDSDSEENTPPACSSADGKLGIGDPGGSCIQCGFNMFGSGSDGKSKACKNMRMLYLLRSGEYMPLQIALPPTSIKPFREFLNQCFALRRRATFGSLVQIGLKRAVSGSNSYSVATFRLLSDFEGEALAQIRAYADSFKEQIRQMIEQRKQPQTVYAAENSYADSSYVENSHADSSYVENNPGSQMKKQAAADNVESLYSNNGQHFCITPDTIDGDREALPA